MNRPMLTLLFATTLFACSDDTGPGDDFSGFIYTSTNSSSGNSIIALGRNSDGSLTELTNSPYPTGSAGDAAEGDFDTQAGLQIVGDYLLAVNAGANPVNGSISVFRINRTDGSLAQVDQNPATSAVDNIDSGGERAASIAATTTGGTTWVVVGNQVANPHFEGDPPQAVGSVTSTSARNLAVFTFDQAQGLLAFQSIGATYTDGTNGGPAALAFNADGSRLGVSTWGVAHILAPDADLTVQEPGRLYLYSFSAGTLTQTGLFEEEGVSGQIGVSWSPNNQYVYVTNFNLHSSKEDNSVTVHDGTTAAKVQNFPSGIRNDEACWTLVSLDQRRLFTASFASNEVSTFDIAGDGTLSVSLNPNSVVRRNVPMPDTKDMYQTPDGFLYVAGAFLSHTVSVFRIGGDGALTEEPGSPYAVPSSAGTTSDQQAFIGLIGFER